MCDEIIMTPDMISPSGLMARAADYGYIFIRFNSVSLSHCFTSREMSIIAVRVRSSGT